GCPWDPWC
uniref:Contryphan-Fic n=1 Tax=Conus figulinus TaxID=101301 RepID=COWC_CONFI|nr:RecName: Full=Contryphan-Fic; Contains: RecName: Full=Contryphan-Fid [Conus figulinus]